MARKSRKSVHQAGELNLTAMIDVAFQLLSFFVITLKPVDVLANLDVSRPEPGKKSASAKSVNIVSIKIYPNGAYTFNDRVMNKETMQQTLKQIGDSDKNATIVIVCMSDSTHGKLCEVLDLCTDASLSNISLLSAY
jgi:biopolymer transport protein ExbD